jgi:hypothetical protein
MNDPTVKLNIVAVIIRWVARGWSIASLGLLLLFFIEEASGLRPLTPSEWLGLLFFPIGVSLGLIISLYWEGLGGGLTIGSLLAFYGVHYVATGRLPKGPYFALLAAPGGLFLVCWLLTRGSKATDDQHNLL